MIQWDIDRYEQLQDSAWELQVMATAQDRSAANAGRRSEGDRNRTRAQTLRQQAAQLLTHYWVLPRSGAITRCHHPSPPPAPSQQNVAAPTVPSTRSRPLRRPESERSL